MFGIAITKKEDMKAIFLLNNFFANKKVNTGIKAYSVEVIR